MTAPGTDSPALLEREVEQGALVDALALVRRSGHGFVVFVAGEAGVGKTSLLRVFAADRPATTTVLWGSCEPLFTPRPFGPLLDVAEALGGELADVVTTTATAHDAVAALSRQLR